jgi:hypothetical protein
VSKSSSYDCKVSLSIDSKQYDRLLKREPRSGGEKIDTFALDRRMIDLPLWKSPDDERIIFQKGSKVFYRLNPKGTHVRVITPKDNSSIRKVLMRVVREFTINHLHRSGNLLIHGAAIARGNKGVIIAGPKQSGKTTLLLHVLRQKGINFTANDRVIVNFDNGKTVLRGLPTIVKLRQKTLEMFSGLERHLLAKKYDYRLTLKEIKSGVFKSMQPDSHGDFSISPVQLCQLLGVGQLSKANLRVVVFPHITGVRGKIRLEELPAELAAKRLKGSLFRAGSRRLTSSAFTLRKGNTNQDKNAVKELCLRLTSYVRCVDCYLGLDAYDRAAGSKFIEQLIK